MFYFGCNACNARWGIGEVRTCTCEKEKPTREWVGLTDEEKYALSDDVSQRGVPVFEAICEAESKLKEKNQ